MAAGLSPIKKDDLAPPILTAQTSLPPPTPHDYSLMTQLLISASSPPLCRGLGRLLGSL